MQIKVMEKNLLFYLLRAMAACGNKTYRKVVAPDMVAVHVNMDFFFEPSEIRFMERFINREMEEDVLTKSALDMCNEMRKTIIN